MHKLFFLILLTIIGLTVFAESQLKASDQEHTTTVSIPAVILTSAESVAVMPVKLDANEMHCLTQNIFFEAGNQSLEGMAAVADVTINRVEQSRYPDTICEVVKQGLKHPNGMMKRNKCQFSWYCDGKSDDITNLLHPGISSAWNNAQAVAKAMLLEYKLSKTNWLGITDGSTHYHANYVVPNWINDNGMKRVGQIGSHIFYKFW